ncbi:two pore domain potassium channel family protein [Alcaligenaceae bacterium CGII-47]|nr:two pore domain potassium channel family protein [Alcaligenaceae bacterium CGII-47]
MYESKDQAILSTERFVRRMVLHVLYALLLIALTLLVGMAGHLWLEPPGWHDALLNTALIVGGIGPYILPETVAGKIFFSLYSIFVGLVFMATLGLTLAPVAHRLIHKFHLDDDQG